MNEKLGYSLNRECWAIRMKKCYAIPTYSADDFVWAGKVVFEDGSWDYLTLDGCYLASPSHVAEVRPITIDQNGKVSFM